MTWGQLKKLVEDCKFYDDDTDIMIYNGLYCETNDKLCVDAKDRIVLTAKNYNEKEYFRYVTIDFTEKDVKEGSFGKEQIENGYKHKYEKPSIEAVGFTY